MPHGRAPSNVTYRHRPPTSPPAPVRWLEPRSRRHDRFVPRDAPMSDRFEDLTIAAGPPPIRLHDLRHGAASLMLAAGVDMEVVGDTGPLLAGPHREHLHVGLHGGLGCCGWGDGRHRASGTTRRLIFALSARPSVDCASSPRWKTRAPYARRLQRARLTSWR